MSSKPSEESVPPGRCRRLLFYLLAFLLMFLLALAVLEIFFRAAGMFTPSAYRRSDVEGLIFEMKPGGVYRMGSHQVRLNGEGFRDEEFSVEKEGRVVRVVCLGDSMTQSIALPPVFLLLCRPQA